MKFVRSFRRPEAMISEKITKRLRKEGGVKFPRMPTIRNRTTLEARENHVTRNSPHNKNNSASA